MSNDEDNTQVFSMFRKFSTVYSNEFKNTRSTDHDKHQSILNNVSPSPIPSITSPPPSEMSISLRYPGISQVATQLNFDKLSDPTLRLNNINPLKRKLDEKEADLLHANAKIIHLENQIETFEPKSKQKLITLEKDYNLCKLQLSTKKKEVYDLQNQLKLLLSNDDESKDLIVDLKKQLEAKRKEYENKLSVLKDKYKQLERKYELQSEKLSKSYERDRKFETMELEMKMLGEKSEQYEKLITEYVEKVKGKNKTISNVEVELNLKQQRVSELENKIKEFEEQSCIQLALKDEIAKLPQLKRRNEFLESEVEKLNKFNCNVLLLSEQNYDLQKKLEKEMDKNKSLQDIMCENESLKNKLSDWEMLSNSEENRNPKVILREIQELKQREAVLILKNGELSSKLNLNQSNTKILQDKINSQISDIDKNKQTLSNYLVSMKRLQKKNTLVTKERDSYKRIIDSYEAEATHNINKYSKERISSFEALIKDYKATIEMYENEFGSVDSILNKRTKPIDNSKIEELTNELKSKEVIIEELKKQIQKPNGNVSFEPVYHVPENEHEVIEIINDSNSFGVDRTLDVQIIEDSSIQKCSEANSKRLSESFNKNHL